MNLGENIKILRLKANYSQADLSSLIGVKRATLGAWEENRNEPSVEDLIKLSDCFGVFVDFLLKADCKKTVTAPMAKRIKSRIKHYKLGELKKYDYAQKDWNKLPRLITV